MQQKICPVCGSSSLIVLENGNLRCRSCDAVLEPDGSDFERRNAFEDAERKLNLNPPMFEFAEEEFTAIIKKYPDWSVGYWGRVRAKYGIKYERDNGKAVPSCYADKYEDFREDHDFKKAVEYAETQELREKYINEAARIAEVCRQWHIEAQKTSYDVFISLKASEGDKDTEDVKQCYNLYYKLRDMGLKVFFSPEELHHIAGKNYEPYIFNALDKAKILIVYGSKPEYFEATWVQNEWSRYLRAIGRGSKEKDSLFVVCGEGMNPKDLPLELRKRQALNRNDLNFFSVLSDAIEDVLSRSRGPVIERVNIQSGKRGKKVAKIEDTIHTVEAGITIARKKTERASRRYTTHELGRGIVEYTADEKELYQTALELLHSGSFKDAKTFLEECINLNSLNGNAMLAIICADAGIKDITEEGIDKSAERQFKAAVADMDDLKLLRGSIEYAKDKQVAENLLSLCCQVINDCIKTGTGRQQETLYNLYSLCTDYDLPVITDMRKNLLKNIKNLKNWDNAEKIYDLMLAKTEQTEQYIERLILIVEALVSAGDFPLADKYCKLLLETDETNLKGIKLRLFIGCGALNEADFVSKADKFSGFDYLDKTLKIISKRDAQELLALFCRCELTLMSHSRFVSAEQFFDFISKYDFNYRDQFLREQENYFKPLATVCASGFFRKILQASSLRDIDWHISARLKFADDARETDVDEARKWYQEVLALEENHPEALKGCIFCDINFLNDTQKLQIEWEKFDQTEFECLLSACDDETAQSDTVDLFLDLCVKYLGEASLKEVMRQQFYACLSAFDTIVRYCEESRNLYSALRKAGESCLKRKEFVLADKYYQLYLKCNTAHNYTARFGLLLIALKCRNAQEFIKCEEFSREMPEYKALLLSCRGKSDTLKYYSDLATQNEETVIGIRESRGRQKERIDRQTTLRKLHLRCAVPLIISLIILIAGVAMWIGLGSLMPYYSLYVIISFSLSFVCAIISIFIYAKTEAKLKVALTNLDNEDALKEESVKTDDRNEKFKRFENSKFWSFYLILGAVSWYFAIAGFPGLLMFGIFFKNIGCLIALMVWSAYDLIFFIIRLRVNLEEKIFKVSSFIFCVVLILATIFLIVYTI